MYRLKNIFVVIFACTAPFSVIAQPAIDLTKVGRSASIDLKTGEVKKTGLGVDVRGIGLEAAVEYADVIFRGEVVDVTYRTNKEVAKLVFLEGGIPYTFVTYKVEEMYLGEIKNLKGDRGTFVTLGGYYEDGHSAVAYEGMPWFKVGERHFVFVKQDSHAFHSLYRREQITAGEVATTDGEEMLLTEDQRIVTGFQVAGKADGRVEQRHGDRGERLMIEKETGRLVRRIPAGTRLSLHQYDELLRELILQIGRREGSRKIDSVEIDMTLKPIARPTVMLPPEALEPDDEDVEEPVPMFKNEDERKAWNEAQEQERLLKNHQRGVLVRDTLYIARKLVVQGQPLAARQRYERVLKLDPGNQEAADYLARNQAR